MTVKIKPELDGKTAAEKFRRRFSLGAQPIGDLIDLVERKMGVDIAVVSAKQGEHGLVMHDPSSGATFMAVAATPHAMRQRSSLAHELAHLLFEDYSKKANAELSERTLEEQRADCFARHLLVPEQGVLEFLDHQKANAKGSAHGSVSFDDFAVLVQRFTVSPSMMAIVLSNLELIDNDTKREWMRWSTRALATKFGWLERYQIMQFASQQRRAPQRLLARAVSAYELGLLTAQDTATLRGISEKQVLKEFEESGIFPQEPEVEVVSADKLPSVSIDWEDS